MLLLGNGNILLSSAPSQGSGIGMGDQDSGRMHNGVHQNLYWCRAVFKSLNNSSALL